MNKFALALLVILLAMPPSLAVDVDNDALGKAEGAKAMLQRQELQGGTKTVCDSRAAFIA